MAITSYYQPMWKELKRSLDKWKQFATEAGNTDSVALLSRIQADLEDIERLYIPAKRG